MVPQTIPQQSNAVSFPKAPASIRNGFYSLSERLKERNELPRQASFIDEKDKKRVDKIYTFLLVTKLNRTRYNIHEFLSCPSGYQKNAIRHRSKSATYQPEIIF